MTRVGTRLRPVRVEEVALVQSWRATPTSPFDDFSGPLPEGVAPIPGGPPPGFDELLVTDDADVPLGTVGWHTVFHGPGAGSIADNVGISLRPEARGAGHGHRALRLVAQHLFATTTVHRVEASTDVTNAAAQHALERAGYRREGVLRGAQWRAGDWHDLVAYSLLRTDRADG